ncbi:MAG: tryptophan synthase subunit beta [Candidatus Coatesbacteria bacterium]|nr:tryptophan synthase subunit beta [Candidatus Coatesbacteria bacterium]
MNKGYFGEFGGQYVPEGLLPYLNNIEQKYNELKDSDSFKSRLKSLLKEYVGRPSPLYFAKNLSKNIGCKIYLKREDLNHTGAHKINNTLGQALLAKSMNKKEIIAETGAGQHGVATATAAALLGMKCKIFMGKVDTIKQKLNVQRISLLGAEVITVERGSGILKDAVDEALGYLIENPEVFYLLGSVVGPHPYPTIVRNFQKIIGEEAKMQIIEQEGRLPDYLIACVGGGSNAMGLFYDFINEENVKLIAVEPAGKGLEPGNHAATLTLGSPGIIHGFKCYLLQDNEGNPADIHSIASGLDYPGVGPEPSMLKDSNRLILGSVTDVQAINAFNYLSRIEGIIPALETSHAIAFILEHSSMFNKDDIIIVNLSGRGDKDVETVLQSNS